MSDFTSGFWSIYIAVLTLVGIAGLRCVLLWSQPQRKRDGRAHDNTTGHVWDEDLRELNNPMPRWWMWLFVPHHRVRAGLPGRCTRAWAATPAAWAGQSPAQYAGRTGAGRRRLRRRCLREVRGSMDLKAVAADPQAHGHRRAAVPEQLRAVPRLGRARQQGLSRT